MVADRGADQPGANIPPARLLLMLLEVVIDAAVDFAVSQAPEFLGGTLEPVGPQNPQPKFRVYWVVFGASVVSAGAPPVGRLFGSGKENPSRCITDLVNPSMSAGS